MRCHQDFQPRAPRRQAQTAGRSLPIISRRQVPRMDPATSTRAVPCALQPHSPIRGPHLPNCTGIDLDRPLRATAPGWLIRCARRILCGRVLEGVQLRRGDSRLIRSLPKTSLVLFRTERNAKTTTGLSLLRHCRETLRLFSGGILICWPGTPPRAIAIATVDQW